MSGGPRLSGKVAVVMGGGSGIGRACCERFAAEGATVVLGDIRDEAGIEVRDMLHAAGASAEYRKSDAASLEDNQLLLQLAVERFGGVDIVVAGAGVPSADYKSDGDVPARLQQLAAAAPSEPIDVLANIDLEDWHRVLDVNLTGTLLAIRAAAGKIRQGGSFIAISSVAGFVPQGAAPAYGVSKAGVNMLVKIAAQILAPNGMRVNAISPGFMETNQTAFISAIPELKQSLVAQIPMGKMGQAVDIANLALFLASDESSYITGEIYCVDGGYFTG